MPAGALRVLIVAFLAVRLGIDAVKAWRREIPATRLAVPATIVLAALLVANEVVPRAVAVAGLFAIDALALVVCFGLLKLVRTPEHAFVWPELRFEKALSAFFPPWFARLVSTDIVVLSHALAGLRAFVNPGPPAAHSYIHGSKIIFVAVIVALSIVPDGFVFWLLIPRNVLWLAIVFGVLDVWACLWLLGIYGTMARRPHEVSPERVVFRNGMVQTVDVRPDDILTARALGIVKRGGLERRRGDGSTVLGFGGVPLVEVVFRRPALEHALFLPGARNVQRAFVPSDAPNALCAELIQLAGGDVGDREPHDPVVLRSG